MFEKELDIIKNSFFEYLSSLGISHKTHKNYRSDLNHFIGWAILKIRSFGSYAETLTEAIPFLSSELAREYLNYMNENKIPVKTINRRLSTLRHLSRFLKSQDLTDLNFTDGLENLGSEIEKRISYIGIVQEYKGHLEAKKASKSTVKNYLSDINQFLSWLENHPELTTNSAN